MFHRSGRRLGVETGVELGHIEPEGDREGLKVSIAECPFPFAVLMVEQIVMILPELTLQVSAFTGFGRSAGLLAAKIAVDDDEMMILKPDVPRLHVLINELARRASGKSPAVWSLKVGEFFNHDLGIGRPFRFAGVGRDG